jgi:hypothetical protein
MVLEKKKHRNKSICNAANKKKEEEKGVVHPRTPNVKPPCLVLVTNNNHEWHKILQVEKSKGNERV